MNVDMKNEKSVQDQVKLELEEESEARLESEDIEMKGAGKGGQFIKRKKNEKKRPVHDE